MTMMKKKDQDKETIIVNKEDDAEDWCFVCKEGGELIICEYGNCLKVYHPYCVKKDNKNSKTEDAWFCDRHSCLKCCKTPKFQCYCCPNSVCEKCVLCCDFVPVQLDSGLCKECLYLVLLGEEDEAYDSDGVLINFKDIDTYEGLFKSYWEIIRKQEGLNDADIHDANIKQKRQKSHKPRSGNGKSKKIHHDNDFCVNESDEDEPKVRPKFFRKEKILKKIEYEEWASKPLTEFLKSINKYSSEPLSHYEVDSIVKVYIRENKLFDPIRKYKVCCDERLCLLFGRKTLKKKQIYNILESHLAENVEESLDETDTDTDTDDDDDDDEERVGKKVHNSTSATKRERSRSVDDDEEHPRKKVKVKDSTSVTKKWRSSSFDDQNEEKKVGILYRPSCFASVVPHNIRLVYLRKSLIEEFCKIPENSEAKVVGSFIRVKTDSSNRSRRNSHQLLPVTGIEISSTGEISLKVSFMEEQVCLSRVSDSDFTEDECKELQEKIRNGSLKKLTVVDLQEKANILHFDVTKDWVKRELVLLDGLIDFANEKGRRRELCDLIERQERLEKPSEQERLLQTLPKVIPDVEEIKDGSNSEACSNDVDVHNDRDNDVEERARKNVGDSTTVTKKERSSSSYGDGEDARKKVKDSVLTTKKERSLSSDDQNEEKKVGILYRPSCFASIIPGNIRLVYLRKSLLEELFKIPKNSEAKVVGSFIRVKTDSQNHLRSNSHQLLPVTDIGIEISSTGEIFLKVSSMEEQVSLSRVSDSEFTEDECKELQEKMANGLLKELTVVDLQEKVNILHCDVTKDWIKRELVLLERRIDFANEKGRRRELYDLIERQERLEKPSEQDWF